MSVDTIVLKIEEIDDKVLNRVDTTLYIFYDHVLSTYCIRGTRRGTYTPYSFTCNSSRDVCLFVENIIGPNNKVSYTLLTYHDLPYESDNINVDYLEYNFDRQNDEIVGYDNVKLKRNDCILRDYLRIIRVMYNNFVRV